MAADGPVRVIDAFVDGLDVRDWDLGARRRREGGVRLTIRAISEALCLRLPERGAFVAAAGARVPSQRGSDVAPASVGAGLQDDRRLSPRQRSDDCRSLPRLCAVLPRSGPFRARLVALDGSKFRAAASPRRIMGRRRSPRRPRSRSADRRLSGRPGRERRPQA